MKKFLPLLAIWAMAFFWIKGHALIGDENTMYRAIEALVKGDFRPEVLFDRDTYPLAVLPTQAVFLALIAKFCGRLEPEILRLAILICGTLSLWLFHDIQSRLGSPNGVKTWQYGLFPGFFPFFFLLYTEIPSLLFIFASLASALRKRHVLCGAFSILAVSIRQTNVVWLVFFFTWLHVEENGWRASWNVVFGSLKKGWLFLLGLGIFAGFVLWNGGVAIDSPDLHPAVFRIENLYFLLFTFFVLFLPLNLANYRSVSALFGKKRTWALLAVFFLVYFLFFTVDHPHNQPRLKAYLHNKVLLYTSENLIWRIVFAAAAGYGVLSIAVTRLTKPSFYLLYPATVLALLPSWLIEPRYYVIPFALFMLFRETKKPSWEWGTVLYYLFFSGLLFQRINTKLFFL